MPRMKADTNLFYHRSTYQKGEEFEVLDTDVKALTDQGHAHLVEIQTSGNQDVETSRPSNVEGSKDAETVEFNAEMKRADLDKIATDMGMTDLEQYSTKSELVEAMEVHQNS